MEELQGHPGAATSTMGGMVRPAASSQDGLARSSRWSGATTPSPLTGDPRGHPGGRGRGGDFDAWAVPVAMARAEKEMTQAGQGNPISMNGAPDAFTTIHAVHGEKLEMVEELRVLMEAVAKLTSVAAEAQSVKGSSLIRTRRTQVERTLEWCRKHGVQDGVAAGSVEGVGQTPADSLVGGRNSRPGGDQGELGECGLGGRRGGDDRAPGDQGEARVFFGNPTWPAARRRSFGRLGWR